ENLLLPAGRIRRDADKHGGRDPITAAQPLILRDPALGDDLRPLRQGGFEIAEDAVALHAIDHRAEFGGGVEPRTDDKGPGEVAEAFAEGIEDRRVDKDARGRTACLPLIVEHAL